MKIFRRTEQGPEQPAEQQPAATRPRPDQEVERRRRRRFLGGAYTGGQSGS